MKTIKYIIGTALILLSVQCSLQTSPTKYRSLGAPGELLVVINDQQIAQDTFSFINELKNIQYPGLIMPEPLFKVMSVNSKEFQNHFKTFRNILILDLETSQPERINYYANKWALNQKVMHLSASSVKELNHLAKITTSKLVNYFFYSDIQSIATLNKKVGSLSVNEKINNRYDISMHFPNGFEEFGDTTNFLWFASERVDMNMGVFVYTKAIEQNEKIIIDSILNTKKELMTKYVHGTNEKSHMMIEEKFPTMVETVIINGMEVIRLRGAWKMNGDFMGGPFITYVWNDYTNKRLIFIDGYVFAPSQNKSKYLREVEAILYSYQLQKSSQS